MQAQHTPSLVDSDGGEIKAARVYTGNEPESIRARPWDILTPVVPFDLLPTNSKEAAAAFFRVMYIVQEEPDARPVQLIDILRRVIDYDRPYPRLRRDPKLKLRMTKRRRLSNESSTGAMPVCRRSAMPSALTPRTDVSSGHRSFHKLRQASRCFLV
ncbi:hypothetical protein P3342_007398 [Pyrenophora teres f. teres]|nr:hypothetical protein P3342_007398 [Pyrenophora teres f. teres]